MPDNTGKSEQREVIPRLKVEAFTSMQGKKLQEVRAKAAERAAGTREYYFILTNPDSKKSKQLQDGKWYYFFGAANNDGVPCMRWRRDGLHVHTRRLWSRWDFHDRPVLHS